MNDPNKPWTTAYGLGVMVWNQEGRRRYGHSGAMPGHWALLLIDQASSDVVVGLANSTYRGLRLSFFDELLSLVTSEQPRPCEPFRPTGTSDDQLGPELVGTWYWGPAEYRIDLDRS